MKLLLHIVVLLFILLTITACSDNRHQSANKSSGTTTVIKNAAVETVKTQLVPETVEFTGTVKARFSAVVSARIAGTVNQLRVREGDRVKKGDLLAGLASQETTATAAAAGAGAEEARRALDEALSRKKLADATLERYKNLFKEQAVTRQEYETKLSEKEVADNGVLRAEARLKQAGEETKAASAFAGYGRITAPISGIVTSRRAELGTTVFPAQPLITIEDDSSYRLELAVPESLSGRIKPGMPVQVSIDAANSTFGARIAEIVPAADPGSRTFTIKVALSRKGLKSGMIGRGTISLGTTVNTMLISKSAVVEHGNLTSVWVLDRDNLTRMRLVKTGRVIGDRVEILSGVSDGERVVTGKTGTISEGAKVE